MSLLSFLLGEKKKTASVAKERLQIILAHERSGRGASRPDYLPALQKELMAVISKYVSIKPEDIKVELERQDNLEVLQASNQGTPAIHLAGSDVAEAYQDVVARFLGEDRPMRFVDAEKPGFFKRIFGR